MTVKHAGEIPSAELLAVERRFGPEDVAVNGSRLWVPSSANGPMIPKTTLSSPPTTSKPGNGAPFSTQKPPDAGRVGLSEITIHCNYAYIAERDNQIGSAVSDQW